MIVWKHIQKFYSFKYWKKHFKAWMNFSLHDPNIFLYYKNPNWQSLVWWSKFTFCASLPTHPSYALSLSICPVVPRKLGLYNQLWEPNPKTTNWLRDINFIILVQISLFFLTVSRFFAKCPLLKSICREKYFFKIILPDIYLICIFFIWPIEPNPI